MLSSETFQEAGLAALRTALAERPYPGYPDNEQRLHLAEQDFHYDALGRLCLPSGVWDLEDTASKPHAGELPNDKLQMAFEALDIASDSLGRPLHPWAKELLTDPALGAFCNRGFYWEWGPQSTADTVAYHEESDSVLLIQRGDTGQWALPGGFVNVGESAKGAARRELKEETGVIIHPGTLLVPVYTGPVADPRTTLHAWADTNCFLAISQEQEACQGADDALAAKWIPVNEAVDGLLFASHGLFLQLALRKLATI